MKTCVGAAGIMPSGGGTERARARASAQPGPSTTYAGIPGRRPLPVSGLAAAHPASTAATAPATQTLQIVEDLIRANLPPSSRRRYHIPLMRWQRRYLRLIEMRGAMSRTSSFSVGCHCADKTRCHRALLREMLVEAGAAMAGHDEKA